MNKKRPKILRRINLVFEQTWTFKLSNEELSRKSRSQRWNSNPFGNYSFKDLNMNTNDKLLRRIGRRLNLEMIWSMSQHYAKQVLSCFQCAWEISSLTKNDYAETLFVPEGRHTENTRKPMLEYIRKHKIIWLLNTGSEIIQNNCITRVVLNVFTSRWFPLLWQTTIGIWTCTWTFCCFILVSVFVFVFLFDSTTYESNMKKVL